MLKYKFQLSSNVNLKMTERELNMATQPNQSTVIKIHYMTQMINVQSGFYVALEMN
jgi:hypothetical protein